MVAGRSEGDVRVFVGSSRSGALVTLAMAVALAGCAGFDAPGSWFAKPLDVLGRNASYNYSELGESKQERRITANDLVDANGACPTAAAPGQTQSAAANPGGSPAASPDADSLLGGGVGIGMSECDVVARVGQPNAVNLGKNPNGDRSAILTFKSGPRPGVYRFVAGRLTEMDRVEVPPPPPQPAKKPAKKKPAKTTPAKTTPAKTAKPQKTDNKT